MAPFFPPNVFSTLVNWINDISLTSFFLFLLRKQKSLRPLALAKGRKLILPCYHLDSLLFYNNNLYQYLVKILLIIPAYRCAVTGTPVASLPGLTYSALRPSSISFPLPFFSKQGSLQTSVTCTLLFKALFVIVVIITVEK